MAYVQYSLGKIGIVEIPMSTVAIGEHKLPHPAIFISVPVAVPVAVPQGVFRHAGGQGDAT